MKFPRMTPLNQLKELNRMLQASLRLENNWTKKDFAEVLPQVLAAFAKQEACIRIIARNIQSTVHDPMAPTPGQLDEWADDLFTCLDSEIKL